ncbi:TetR/AcrR family transcriptional regulator [Pseudomonadales bacterium]|jgi:TetR/AcrR family transcriptional regulator, fatty acid biosynthesis regulator|nr:TetR/AcrR family transcriptional regulator [Pseudomonadales bacterium]MDA9298536.1 TetR/AcrR family transcriptional regulator [Pseudomonadales bacterium]MDB9918184.1 TetR/AcrR family transcriptional regulator [Pseudomonadales bacterium]MDC1308236.1 TetR/AcrR family transcriptional regulator [Pseudomonadales bacterium]
MSTASKKSPQASTIKRSRMTPTDRTTEILNAAVRLVLRDGTSRLTMDAVAQAAGVSKALVYTYFPNLATLLQQVYRRENQQLHQQYLEALAEPYSFESMVKTTAHISRVAQSERQLIIKRLSSDPVLKRSMAKEDLKNRVGIMAFLVAEIVEHFDIPPAIAHQATALALGYDPVTVKADAPSLDDVWGAMIVGAMRELEKRYGSQQEQKHE